MFHWHDAKLSGAPGRFFFRFLSGAGTSSASAASGAARAVSEALAEIEILGGGGGRYDRRDRISKPPSFRLDRSLSAWETLLFGRLSSLLNIELHERCPENHRVPRRQRRGGGGSERGSERERERERERAFRVQRECLVSRCGPLLEPQEALRPSWG